MIARISCSRTSKETSTNALIPPKVNEACWTCSSTSPVAPPGFMAIVLPAVTHPGRRDGGNLRGSCGPCHRRVGSGRAQLQGRRHGADAAVLEAHLGLDILGLAPRVQGLDQGFVFARNEAPPHLA